MKSVIFIILFVSTVFLSPQNGEQIVREFLKESKSDKTNDQILSAYIIDYDKKHTQDKEFIKMVLESLRERIKGLELDNIEISKPVKKDFIYGDSSLNPEIFKVKLNTVESKDSFFILYEQNKIKSFVTMNKGSRRVFMY